LNIGIIFHSSTGNTRALAQKIESKLIERNHSVTLRELKTDKPVKSGKQKNDFTITNLPDCADYDAILVGSPVWAFSASPVVINAIESLQNISGKIALPFVTMGFPFPFMGGTSAIRDMNKHMNQKGAILRTGAIAPMLFRNFKKSIENASSAAVEQL